MTAFDADAFVRGVWESKPFGSWSGGTFRDEVFYQWHHQNHPLSSYDAVWEAMATVWQESRCVVAPSSLAITDPYDPQQQPATAGSMWAPDMNGQQKPQGRPEDIPTVTIQRTR